jgi:acyl-CoA synthetase (AMP-forming)/AMP-acid ligase II
MKLFDGITIAENIRVARLLNDVPPEQYPLPVKSFAALCEQRAAQMPDKIFLSYYDDDTGEQSQFSFAKINRRVNQLANFLRERHGVQRGEKLAIVSFNHPDSIIACLACWKLGVVATPQNASEDDSRIAFILSNADCRVALVRPEYRERMLAIQKQVTCLKTIVVMDGELDAVLNSSSADFTPPADNMLEDEALLVYTSGTTGAPKGVMQAQCNLLTNCKAAESWLNLTDDVRMMCVLPVHHVNGLIVTHVLPMYVGGSVVLNRGFKASVFWQRLAQHKIHYVSVVPTILQFLCEANEDVSGLDLTNLRSVLCGAGTLSVSLVTRFQEQFGVNIMHGYGLSETTAFACLTPNDLSRDEQRHWLIHYGYPSIGVAMDCNEMAILDPQGKICSAGEKGEIVLRGHNVMVGYFKRDDANAEAFQFGWFRSGDEGFYQRDKRGRQFYFITGRIKELINRGGVKYSPFEIEEVLQSIPGVKVGLAIAFDNEWYGEEVGAYIVTEEGADLSEGQVLAACRKAMPFSKSPKAIKFGTDIPVTTTGKYQRLKLKDLFREYRDTQFKDAGR